MARKKRGKHAAAKRQSAPKDQKAIPKTANCSVPSDQCDVAQAVSVANECREEAVPSEEVVPSEDLSANSPEGDVVEAVKDVECVANDECRIEAVAVATECREEVVPSEDISSNSPEGNVVEAFKDEEGVANKECKIEVSAATPECGEEVARPEEVSSNSPQGNVVAESDVEVEHVQNNMHEEEVTAATTECGQEVARPEDMSSNSPQGNVVLESIVEVEHVQNNVQEKEVEEAVLLPSNEAMPEEQAFLGMDNLTDEVAGNQDQEPTQEQEAEPQQGADACACLGAASSRSACEVLEPAHDSSGFSDRTTAASTETEPAGSHAREIDVGAPVDEATRDLEKLAARLRQEEEELQTLRTAIHDCKQESGRLMEQHTVKEQEVTIAPSWWRAELVAMQSQVRASTTQLCQRKMCLEDRHAKVQRLVGARAERIQSLEKQVASFAHAKGNEALPGDACSDADGAVLRARRRLLEDKQQYASGLRPRVESQDAKVKQLVSDLQGTLTFMVRKMLKAEGRRASLTEEGGRRSVLGSHGGVDEESPISALERRLGLSSYGCDALRVASDRASIAAAARACSLRASIVPVAGSTSLPLEKGSQQQKHQQQVQQGSRPRFATYQGDEVLEERLSVMVRSRPMAKSRVRWGRHTITGGSRPLGLEQTI